MNELARRSPSEVIPRCSISAKNFGSTHAAPDNHPDDDDRGDERLPSLGVEIEAGAFELKVMVGHDTALHLEA